jgi:hypothetical protein
MWKRKRKRSAPQHNGQSEGSYLDSALPVITTRSKLQQFAVFARDTSRHVPTRRGPAAYLLFFCAERSGDHAGLTSGLGSVVRRRGSAVPICFT